LADFMNDFIKKSNEYNHRQLSFLMITGDSLVWSIEY